MPQKLLARLMIVEAGNISEYLVNKIYLIIYNLYRTKGITETVQFNY